MQVRLFNTCGNRTVSVLSDQALSLNPWTLRLVSLHVPRAICIVLEGKTYLLAIHLHHIYCFKFTIMYWVFCFILHSESVQELVVSRASFDTAHVLPR
jgi:hypothetical protein